MNGIDRNRALAAAERHLVRCGYEIIEVDWKYPEGEVDIIAKEGEDLVFVSVSAHRHLDSFHAFDQSGAGRALKERAAGAYLIERGRQGGLEGEFALRFDNIDLIVLEEDKALLRHHVNAV